MRRGGACGVAVAVIVVLVTPLACTKTQPDPPPADAGPAGTATIAASATVRAADVPATKMTLTSSSFDAGGAIPTRFTCEGQDLSPQLGWTAPPAGTKSLALVVSDPDAPDPKAPEHTWVHWVLYDLPPSMRELPEGVKEPPMGSRAGANDFKRMGWNGPCPPIGRHRYVYELYALDTQLPDLMKPGKADLEKAMAGHVLAKGELVGTYQKIAK